MKIEIRNVKHHPDLSEETEAFAATFADRRTMIYAVTAEGRSAYIKNA